MAGIGFGEGSCACDPASWWQSVANAKGDEGSCVGEGGCLPGSLAFQQHINSICRYLSPLFVAGIGFGEGSCACDPASWWQSVANAKGDEGSCVGEGGCLPGSLAFQQHINSICRYLSPLFVAGIGFGEGSCACDPASWWQSVANAKGDEGACVGEGGCIPGSLAFQRYINSISTVFAVVCRCLRSIFVAGIGFGVGSCACDPASWWQSVANAKGDEGACVGEGGCLPGSLAFQRYINSICRYLSPGQTVANVKADEGSCVGEGGCIPGSLAFQRYINSISTVFAVI